MRKQPTSVHESCRRGQKCPGHERAINPAWGHEGPGETKLPKTVPQFPICKRIVPIAEGFSEKLIQVKLVNRARHLASIQSVHVLLLLDLEFKR